MIVPHCGREGSWTEATTDACSQRHLLATPPTTAVLVASCKGMWAVQGVVIDLRDIKFGKSDLPLIGPAERWQAAV